MHFRFTISSIAIKTRHQILLSLGIVLFIVQTTWAQKAYIPNLDDNTVSVIDLTADSVTATIDVGGTPIGIAISKTFNKVYICESNTETISVINAETDVIEATIDVGGVNRITIDPFSRYAYVGDANFDVIKVIELSTDSIVDIIPIEGTPLQLMYNPIEYQLLVTNGNKLSIMRTHLFHDVDANLNMDFPHSIVFSPNGEKAYVTEFFGDRISEVDLSDHTATPFIEGIISPKGIAISPDGSTLYVTSETGGGAVQVIDVATAEVTSTLNVGSGPESINIGPFGEKAYVVNYLSNDVSVIDMATNTVETSIAVGNSPQAIGNFILPGLVVPGDRCIDAFDINYLFGQELEVPQTSAMHNNVGATATDDPDFGFDCFTEFSYASEPSINNSLWFTFQGDGDAYRIRTVQCGDIANYFEDTQAVLYTGEDCDNLTSVLCNDDQPGFGNFEVVFETETVIDSTYQLMIDGYFGYISLGLSEGEFCLEVTRLSGTSTKDIQVEEMTLFPNPTTGVLYIDQPGLETVEVYNDQGQLVFSQNQVGREIDISHLPAGMYFIKAIGADSIYTGRVVKK